MKLFIAIPITALILSSFASLSSRNALAEEDAYKPVKDKVVAAECSECHMLYPVGLLPGSSWGKIIDGLTDHFGQNASVLPEDAAHIRAYLTGNGAAERRALYIGPIKPSPLRITEMDWFKGEHGPKRISLASLAKYKAKSPADCVACHKDAERGLFDD